MPILRFADDGSIGQALSQLAAGINAANDPKAALQGEYIRQQIAASKANAAKTLLETQNLRDQNAAQEALGTAALGAFDAQFPRPQTTLAPDVQGPPMPQEVAQGLNNSYDANRGLFSASVRNAAARGGGPLDALRIGPVALAQAGNMMNGVPTDEMAARRTQAMLTGQLPDAKTPFTDTARQTMGNEELERQKALEAYKISKNPLDVTGGKTYAIPQQDGSHKIFGPEQYGGVSGGGITGDSELAQLNRIMEVVAVKGRQGTIGQNDLDAYDVAWNRIYGPKTEIRDINGTPTAVQIQNPIPANRPSPAALRQHYGLQPGLTAGAPPAPAPAAAPGAASTPSADGAPVFTDQAPAAAPAAAPGGVAVGAPLGAAKPMGNEATKLGDYATRMKLGDAQLNDIVDKGKLPAFAREMAANPDTWGKADQSPVMRQLGPRYLAGEDANTHAKAADTFLDAVLRNQSGAVIGSNEYQKVASYTIPNSADTPAQIAMKKANRALLINAYEKGFLGEDPKVIIRQAQSIIENAMAQQQQGGPGPAPAAAGGARPRTIEMGPNGEIREVN